MCKNENKMWTIAAMMVDNDRYIIMVDDDNSLVWMDTIDDSLYGLNMKGDMTSDQCYIAVDQVMCDDI